MKISSNDIEAAFDDLLSRRKSREEIAAWVTNIRAHDHRGETQYEQSSARLDIQRALEYLGGVDLKDAPHSYLHSEADFWKFRGLWRCSR
jgi:hypothetical protein